MAGRVLSIASIHRLSIKRSLSAPRYQCHPAEVHYASDVAGVEESSGREAVATTHREAAAPSPQQAQPVLRGWETRLILY